MWKAGFRQLWRPDPAAGTKPAPRLAPPIDCLRSQKIHELIPFPGTPGPIAMPIKISYRLLTIAFQGENATSKSAMEAADMVRRAFQRRPMARPTSQCCDEQITLLEKRLKIGIWFNF